MPGYSCIVCHVNILWSGTTYSHFCIKHSAKKAEKLQIIPKFAQKQTKNPHREIFKTQNVLK